MNNPRPHAPNPLSGLPRKARRRRPTACGVRGWLGLLLVLCCLGTAPIARAQSSREYDLKAVLLFNLTRFVEWPASAFAAPDAPFVIGILGQDPFGKVLDDVVAAESYGEHKIQVVRFRDVVSAKRCQIVFVSADEKLNLARILSGLRRPALLTVGDFEGFAKGGGMINLRQAPDGKVRLRINLDAVRASELIVSGKLLRVAEVVNAEVKN